MWNRIRRISGIRAADLRVGLALVLGLTAALAAGCNYTFVAGAGLPGHVRTLAVIPFENETTRFELSQELHEALVEELPRAFGVRTGGEEFADAVVTGTVRRYSVEAPSYRPGSTGDRTDIVERQVLVAVEVQVVDRVQNVILWESTNLQGRGEYLEASEFEDDGRRLAVSRLVRSVIDGLQSNW
jgi:hypothetical protein